MQPPRKLAREERERGMLFPPQSNILATEVATAIAVAEMIFTQNITTVKKPKDIKSWLENKLYNPEYSTISG